MVPLLLVPLLRRLLLRPMLLLLLLLGSRLFPPVPLLPSNGCSADEVVDGSSPHNLVRAGAEENRCSFPAGIWPPPAPKTKEHGVIVL